MAATATATVVAKCECCGLTEDCTSDYITHVRARHHGRWICGLCSEAVGDEARRCGLPVTAEEAIELHATFRSSPPPPVADVISAVSRLLRRSLRLSRSLPGSPQRDRVPMARSESCFPALRSVKYDDLQTLLCNLNRLEEIRGSRQGDLEACE